MVIKLCSKPQQFNAVTPTPLAHSSHSCMRALALGHDNIACCIQVSKLNVVKVNLERPVRYDRACAKVLPACTTVSAIWLWPTVLVHNMVSAMYFES